MPQSIDPALMERTKERYLKDDKNVNLKEYYRKQQALEKSGLQDIDILQKPKSLGKDDFLKILVTQLTHQDPTQPMKDQDFIAQMAQFSSLEQMQNISGSLTRLADRQGLQLVGKVIAGPDFRSGEDVSGSVQALFYGEDGQAFLKVDDHAVLLSEVKMISDEKNVADHAKQISGSEIQPNRASAPDGGSTRHANDEVRFPNSSGLYGGAHLGFMPGESINLKK